MMLPPLNTAGFNAMVMPIHYEDPDGLGDPDEAYAFSFLLSNALDWAPGSYCMRQAFFVHSQSPELVRSLASNYAPELVGKAVRSWQASHGVGGTLVKSKNGYSGSLEIFGTNGKQIDRESFDDPRPYFDLLGDMSAAAMKFLGEPANDALVQYLKIPRCKDMKSVAQLGSMAYMDRQTILNTVNSVRQQITPWDVAAAVSSLTEQSKFQDAIDLAWKYTNFVSGTGDANFFWPCHLAHLVEMLRDAPKDEN